AMFMYDDDHGRRLVVLTRPMTTDQSAQMTPQSSDSVSGFTWADDGIGYSLVGQRAAESLRPIANDVPRQPRPILFCALEPCNSGGRACVTTEARLCPLLALSGHRLVHRTCPLSGVMRT